MEVTATAADENRKIRFIVNIFYFAFIFIILFLIFKYAAGWFMPFIIGLILATIVQRPARFITAKTKLPQKISCVMCVLLLVAILGLLIFGIIMLISQRLSNMTMFVGSLMDTLKDALGALCEKIKPFMNQLKESTGITVDLSSDGLSQVMLRLTNISEIAVNALQGFFSKLPTVFLDTIVTIVAASFIAADYRRTVNFLYKLIPERYRKTVYGIKNFIFGTVLKLLRAYLTLMLITFTELSIGLALIGINNPIGIAAIIAVVDILPVLGTGTIIIPWSIIELLLGNTLRGVCLLILYLIVTVVRNILEPKIVGNHIGLHPLITLTAIIVGLKSLGLLGMIGFPIIILILKDLTEKGVIQIHVFKK